MPFTPAHAAAALPFRRIGLVTSALVIGTFAPDFEYFLRLAPSSGFGHSLPGAFLLSLPLAMVILWIFHAIVKLPMVDLLPNNVQRRLGPYLGKFPFFGFRRFSLIVASILLGIATHILWDSFTHPTTWLYRYWSFLGQTLDLPLVGKIAYYKLFQHGSTLVGMAALFVWLILWYRAAQPGNVPVRKLTLQQKLIHFAIFVALATFGAIVRIAAGVGMPSHLSTLEGFAGEAVCTVIALIWWQLVIYGLIRSTRQAT